MATIRRIMARDCTARLRATSVSVVGTMRDDVETIVVLDARLLFTSRQTFDRSGAPPARSPVLQQVRPNFGVNINVSRAAKSNKLLILQSSLVNLDI